MCISDIGFRGLGDLPLNTLRKITKVLQDVFKSRLAYSGMINCPKSIHFIYSLLKPFLDPVTIEKISIAQDNVAHNVIDFFDPYQVEEKYGGKAQNLTVYWPPVFPTYEVENVPEVIEERVPSQLEIELSDTEVEISKKKKKKKRKSKRNKTHTTKNPEENPEELENEEIIISKHQPKKQHSENFFIQDYGLLEDESSFITNEKIVSHIVNEEDIYKENEEENEKTTLDVNKDLLIESKQVTTYCGRDAYCQLL